MTKQNKNLIALAVLIVATGISYRINRIVPPVIPLANRAQAAKAAQQDNPLAARFHRVRAEMDGLYHYRIKPVPFDNSANPFRLSTDLAVASASPQPSVATKIISDQAPVVASKDELGDALLAHAIAVARLGGVVVMNDTTQLIVDGQLHKEGDVFTVKVHSRLVLIRIKYLSTTFATLSLDDPQAGVAEIKIGLK